MSRIEEMVAVGATIPASDYLRAMQVRKMSPEQSAKLVAGAPVSVRRNPSRA